MGATTLSSQNFIKASTVLFKNMPLWGSNMFGNSEVKTKIFILLVYKRGINTFIGLNHFIHGVFAFYIFCSFHT